MRPDAQEAAFRIGEVARALDLHPNSLRRAEREQRIPEARRERVSRQRFYTPEDLEVLRERFARR
ncbi:MAG: MerR family transcriptional regulator [Elusimicrobia bacterium]|nr:MerR family transcriptional regulator [Elusimicrobiota bacterium]